MDIRVKFKHGPLDIEIEAKEGEREKYKEEIVELLNLVDEHVGSLDSPERTNGESGEKDEFNEAKNNFEEGNSPISPLAANLEINPEKLDRVIHYDGAVDEALPHVIVDEIGILGDTLPERQRVAALVIMYVVYVCDGVEEVTGPDLKEALDASDLSTNNMYKIRKGEGKSYFDHNGGKGNASRIALRGPGRRKAREEISRLVDDIEE